MVYTLQTFRHYLLGSHFKFFTDHFALKYMVNKLVFEGQDCIWLLLFWEFTFEFIIKTGKLNVGPDHFSRLGSGESGRDVYDQLPYENIFHIEDILDYLSDISLFLTTCTIPKGYSTT